MKNENQIRERIEFLKNKFINAFFDTNGHVGKINATSLRLVKSEIKALRWVLEEVK